MSRSVREVEGIEGWRTQSVKSASRRLFESSESIFATSASVRRSTEDEEDLKWAALEKLPTYNRLTVSLLQREQSKSGHQRHDQVDVRTVDQALRDALLDRLVGIIEQDNEFFVQKLRERIDKVGITLPEVEVRYECLSVDAEAYVGGRAMPTLLKLNLMML